MPSVTHPLQHFFSNGSCLVPRKNMMGRLARTNLRFADDIDALAEDEQELESLDKTCTRYKMEISDQTDDKQCQWPPERGKGKRAEVGHCNKFQVPRNSCFR